MTSLMFYEDVALLDLRRHRDLKLKRTDSYLFAAAATAVPMVVGEFADAIREYPIVFMRAQNNSLLPVVVTGTKEGKNDYIDGPGNWNAKYIPMFIRRYPFIFGSTPSGSLAVCIDETWPGFDEEDGEALFEPSGEPTPMLLEILDRLADYQKQVELTERFMARLATAGLLIDISARKDVVAEPGSPILSSLVVDEEKFRSLPDATLKAWLVSGELGYVYAHLMSLRNHPRA